MNVIISGGACQDLRRIEDQAVRAELVHLAQAELRVPESGSAIEGRLRDYPHMWGSSRFVVMGSVASLA